MVQENVYCFNNFLRKLKDDWTAVRAYLNKTEEYLTKDIDFVSYMVKQ